MSKSQIASVTAGFSRVFACALCFFAADLASGNASPIISKQSAAEGVTIPLMGHDPVKPAATLKVRRFDVGSQRHGFFRVGLLPLLIARDAQITFSCDHPDPSALADLVPAFQAIARNSNVEIHHLTLLMPGEAEPELTAEQGEPAGNGEWKLMGITIARPMPLHISEAVLQTQGAQGGWIVYQKGGVTQSFNLFSSKHGEESHGNPL